MTDGSPRINNWFHKAFSDIFHFFPSDFNVIETGRLHTCSPGPNKGRDFFRTKTHDCGSYHIRCQWIGTGNNEVHLYQLSSPTHIWPLPLHRHRGINNNQTQLVRPYHIDDGGGSSRGLDLCRLLVQKLSRFFKGSIINTGERFLERSSFRNKKRARRPRWQLPSTSTHVD